jgi:hypothetical protein
MADNKENGQTLTGALTTLSKAIEVLASLPKEITFFLADQAEKRADNVRPNYPAAAQAFKEIAEQLRASFQRLVKFINEVVDLRSKDLDEKSFKAFLEKYRENNVEEIASKIKFKCAEIDTIYTTRVESWFKNFLGIDNVYAEKIVAEKGATADQLLKNITGIDAALVEEIGSKIIDPLRKDVQSIVHTDNKKEQKRLHSEMQKRYREIIATLEDSLRNLDDAVIKFQKLAERRVGNT